MHSLSFLLALAFLILGMAGVPAVTSAENLRSFVMPHIFFGGAVLFTSFYAIKEPRHGLAGAAFLVFLAFLTNAATCIGAVAGGSYEWSRLEHRNAFLVLLLSSCYLALALRSWKQARRKRAIAELENGAG